MQTYQLFYRENGIRKFSSLLSPIIRPVFNLPKNSWLHLYSNEPEILDIDTDNLAFSQYKKRIYIEFINELQYRKGLPNPRKFDIVSNTREWLHKNHEFKMQRDPHLLRNEEDVLYVTNYNYIKESYRYIDNPLTEYNKWFNAMRTIITRIQEVSQKSRRQHFIYLKAPRDPVSISLMKTYLDKVNEGMLKIFDTSEKLFILEFFKWLDPEQRTGETIFAPLKNYDKVNFIVIDVNGNSTVLNLGFLNSWIEGQANSTDSKTVAQYAVTQVRTAFVTYLTNHSFSNIEEDTEAEKTLEQEDPTIDNDLKYRDAEIGEENENDIDDDIIKDNSLKLAVLNSVEEEKKQLAKKKEIEIIQTSSNIEDVAAETIEAKISNAEKDLTALEVMNIKKLKNRGIHVDNKGNVINVNPTDKQSKDEIKRTIFEGVSLGDSLKSILDENSEYGLINPSQYKILSNKIKNIGNQPDPYGSGMTVNEILNYSLDELKLDQNRTQIKVSEIVSDRSLAESSLLSFDYTYNTKQLPRDILGMIQWLQRSGVIIESHSIEVKNSILGEYEHHSLTMRPIDGQPSTVHFKIPKVKEDGTLYVNTNKTILRKQRIDVPFRKIDPTTVALSSYYGKTFVELSSKKSNSSVEWLSRQINIKSISENPTITQVNPSNVFQMELEAPYLYLALSTKYQSFRCGSNWFSFDIRNVSKYATEEQISLIHNEIGKNSRKICGKADDGSILIMNRDNSISKLKDGQIVPIGDMYSLLDLNVSKSPIDYSELRVFSKNIPVGVVLSYYVGFENMLTAIDAKYEVIDKDEKNKRKLSSYEYSIEFLDKTYIFNRKDSVVSKFVAGFRQFNDITKSYPVETFNKKDIYFNLLETMGITAIYMKELDISDKLFVDYITSQWLSQKGYPVTFKGLLIRATEELDNYNHRHVQDIREQMIRGYDRFAGTVYKRLSQSIRKYNSKNITGRSKVDISPYEIWRTILDDPAMKIIEDTNPIQNLKEVQVVTYVGEGGRDKQSLTKPTRAMHVEDIGVVSEATPDSADVGINAFLSQNPQLASLRGDIVESKKYEASNILSTSCLLAPFVDRDDYKRGNFVSIQNSHVVPCKGYHPPVVRTGQEYVMAQLTSDMFAYSAKEDGEVISLTDKGIMVKYESGIVKGVALGRQFGKAEGSVYPHDIATRMKVGDKFKKGDIISYNTNFFEYDFLDQSTVVYKGNQNIELVLLEAPETYEDSCSVNIRLSDRFKLNTTKIKSVVVDFEDSIHSLVKVGDFVAPNSPLMVIENEVTTGLGFDLAALDILKDFSKQTPTSSYHAIIDKIEVIYNGDLEDMSETLKQITSKSNEELKKECEAIGKEVIEAKATDEYRVSGVKLAKNKAEIRIYMTIEDGLGVGDKVIFGNQMKSVIGEVMTYDIRTESGILIDAKLSRRAPANRIVSSLDLIGTTTTVAMVLSKKAAQLYRSLKK